MFVDLQTVAHNGRSCDFQLTTVPPCGIQNGGSHVCDATSVSPSIPADPRPGAELGHHHDRMTTWTKRQCGRGESFAESFAREHEDEIIARYQKAFRY